jgi:hypothetical protein
MSENVKGCFEPLPFRIRIGVSGHREIPNPDQLETRVQDAIDKTIWELFEPRDRGRLDEAAANGTLQVLHEVISPLAEGADQLVAKVVLRRKNARLTAVLPLTEHDYLETFESGEAKERFGEMLSDRSRVIRLRKKNIEDSLGPEGVKQARRDAYEDVGRYVIDHCDLLIALWDGKRSNGRGGTGEIVEYAVAERRPVIRIWGDTCSILNPAIKINTHAVVGLRRFNMCVPDAGEREKRRARFTKMLFGPDGDTTISQELRNQVESWLLPYYIRSSFMAGRSQSQFFRLGNFVYTLSALAVGCVALAVLVDQISVAGFGLELCLLIVIIGAILWSHRVAPSTIWLESRLLTERIRCAGFLALCGLDADPLEVLPFMSHAHGADDWMVRAFDEICFRKPVFEALPDILDLKEHVLREWMDAQIRHHRDTQLRERIARRKLEWAGTAILVATTAAAAMHLAWGSLPEALRSHHWIHSALSLVAILFPALAAALVGIQVQREHHRLSMRSASFAKQIERLTGRMRTAVTRERFTALLGDADELMLRESQDWLMLMRHVEIKAG